MKKIASFLFVSVFMIFCVLEGEEGGVRMKFEGKEAEFSGKVEVDKEVGIEAEGSLKMDFSGGGGG